MRRLKEKYDPPLSFICHPASVGIRIVVSSDLRCSERLWITWQLFIVYHGSLYRQLRKYNSLSLLIRIDKLLMRKSRSCEILLCNNHTGTPFVSGKWFCPWGLQHRLHVCLYLFVSFFYLHTMADVAQIKQHIVWLFPHCLMWDTVFVTRQYGIFLFYSPKDL